MENEMRSLYNNSGQKNARQGVHERKGCKCAWEVQMIKLADGAGVGGFFCLSAIVFKRSRQLGLGHGFSESAGVHFFITLCDQLLVAVYCRELHLFRNCATSCTTNTRTTKMWGSRNHRHGSDVEAMWLLYCCCVVMLTMVCVLWFSRGPMVNRLCIAARSPRSIFVHARICLSTSVRHRRAARQNY